ncbi:putative NADP-dependent oxidoreductase [Caenibius tardaugens NBRC 16725]|uniref:Putative NADP-dependent oxidoreductase n=1 Tax=Caenibius tardaugens NBRC 16725 TaxID=1219035 RepID=U2Y7T0_9SPHN|nr:NADP-dependent oxidoreductase [Caenibius tardaugens]AZI36614.1 NADP-dependent oxidoreductase [Caenibius tardaugens NBRC 16725]GAD49266.1 putative NADP-dependent oxidoreductase [Caenibius tardaugens NBRC 16725]
MVDAKRWYFRERPTGKVDAGTFDYRDEILAAPSDGEFLLKTLYLSLDATNRVWISDWDMYMEPVHIGEPMRGFVFGEVIASRNPLFPVGAYAAGLHSWSSHIVTDSTNFDIFPALDGIDLATAFAVLSVAGPTAHIGLFHIGELKAGDTVVVSGAAGAVGTLVGQIARLAGARVIGIAGGPKKCAMLRDSFGFDAAIDYRTEDVCQRLGQLCPDGIDLCFENVGGAILDASLANMKDFGRVVICGLIASYNSSEPVPGPYMFRNLIMRRLTVRGFVVLDHQELMPAAISDLTTWLREGKLRMLLHMVEGLESAPEALNLLYSGGNIGKLLVKL